MLIVITIVGILATIAHPSYLWATKRAREAVLKENLFAMRDTIDQYFADKGTYPGSLDDLVAAGYLRRVPEDPFTKRRDSWSTVPPPEEPGAVFDVRSGSPEVGSNGIPYADW
jgi:general secretion pathway protein G